MKDKRQQKIIEIISSQDVETQDELIKHLSDAGFTTTQATVSRDIRALKLRKVAGEPEGTGSFRAGIWREW